ncbi:hypothetical protein CJP72_13005 [Citrobacter sp. NCU1]|nr:hypothetical protein [Citrobacter sp. NCU1]
MSNISYIVLFITSITFAILGLNFLYLHDVHGSEMTAWFCMYIATCYVVYLFMLRVFHPFNWNVHLGGIIYLVTFTFIPFLIGLMELIDCFARGVFSLLGWELYEQIHFLNMYEIHIYITITSLLALGVTWLFDTLLVLIMKREKTGK